MLGTVLTRRQQLTRRALSTARARVGRWTQLAPPMLASGLVADLARSRREPILETALLRQQLLVLRRTAKRPGRPPGERGLLVLLASRLRTRASARVIVQPDTVLRWHRRGFRLVWRRKSAPRARPSPLAAATIGLIRQMARDNPLWGAERIRGALLKLGIRAGTRTIQRSLRQARPPRPPGRRWSTFVRHHAQELWAGDFPPVTDLRFRPLVAFFVVALGSRRVVRVGVTRRPTDAWVAQHQHEATPGTTRPRYLIRDNDREYGPRFDRLAAASGITVPRTPVGAPRANAVTERCLGSVRRAGRDHRVMLGERHLRRVLREYAGSFCEARPHQGRAQRLPAGAGRAPTPARCHPRHRASDPDLGRPAP